MDNLNCEQSEYVKEKNEVYCSGQHESCSEKYHKSCIFYQESKTETNDEKSGLAKLLR